MWYHSVTHDKYLKYLKLSEDQNLPFFPIHYSLVIPPLDET
jgi:hypothetical protein